MERLISAPSYRKGTASELRACIWLLSQGYEVFRNIAPAGPADIVVFNQSGPLFIDVKTLCYNQDGSPIFHRIRSARAESIGIKLLYVLKDGTCAWPSDIDPNFGKPNGVGIAIDENNQAACPYCKQKFFQKRSMYQRYCSRRCRDKNQTAIQTQRKRATRILRKSL